MKKKILIILSVIVLITIIICTMYLIDKNRMKNNEPVIFSTSGYDYCLPVETYLDFEITVKESRDIKKEKILNNKDIDEYGEDFDLYYTGLEEVRINVDGKTMLLEEALKSKKITLDEIETKAKRDLENEKITGKMYKDGGSMEYHYDTYTIIKCNSLNGDRDLYIGMPEMHLSELR